MRVDRIVEAPISAIEVHGLVEADLAIPESRVKLRDLWIEHGLIVFRGLTGPAMQIRLSEVFGPCVEHPGRQIDRLVDYPQLVSLPYRSESGDIYEVDGRELGAWLPWHSDLIYVDKINHGGILRPLILPASGGSTGFIDKIALYDALPPSLKQRIEPLKVAYKWDLDIGNQRFGAHRQQRVVKWSAKRLEMQSRLDEYPEVLHPLVFVQPETGRKVLNYSPWFSLYVAGVDEAESRDLLTTLSEYCTDESRAYFHVWRTDDMVLWDNWRMLHNATGVPVDAERLMQRTTIAGDYGLGALVNAADEIDDRIRVNV